MDLGHKIKNCDLIGIVELKKQAKSSEDSITTAIDGHTSTKPHRPFNSRIIQNFILIWLHSDIDDDNDNEFRNSIIELQRVVNAVITFTDVDECISTIIDIKDEKVLIIISGEFDHNIVPLLHSLTQINSIYIFCKNGSKQKQWAQQWPKANELYEFLLDQSYNDREKTHFYHQLGWSKKSQRKYEEAIICYEKSLEIKQKVMPPNHSSFAVSFNEIGSVYEKMNKYTKALLYYEKGLAIQYEMPSSNNSGLAYTYSNIGTVYEKMNDYSKALSFHEKALEIRQNEDSSNNLTLAFSYNHIGSVYEKMNDYSEALSSHKKALEIQQKILPPNHPDLAQTYSNIGFVYCKMGQYSKALQFHQQAVDIGKRSLPANHPRLQPWLKNLEYIKRKI
ncbi:unnamed protein product [Rotaria sordida]|uniref:Uncharacterized protein n=1 Tax=Rotaria sordida TaxID=392033 RepID=A0A818Z7Z3_9BILA|nr:unnamed protein product [Rotaria sordida]CAF3794346.1 unnamed protein product [Rotaria sordida]